MNRRYRKTIIAGNWKMNKLPGESKDFIVQLKEQASAAKWCDIVLCVPFTHLHAAVKAARGTRIAIGAQNCHFAEKGAYTGEVSCRMLADMGVKYVIIGHSERRQYFGETDSDVNKKVKAAIDAGLRPIICLGESLEIRENGAELDHIRMQLKAALKDIDAQQLRKVVIAYEPIWAIGTGRIATPQQADEVGSAIRETLRSIYGARAARGVSILYGGSLSESNAGGMFAMPDVDGGLIGGASLEPASLASIIDAAQQD
ncbi:MAG: triose-phosphate isomerase [Clostridia bacterium]|nr:triose-phosphate isomerase [Clostridia bacterium]MBQ3062229.1 triose-phosphate isomerase [Clostridia bacterium]MBQ9966684.1 triose-phosphate isomerase [Clostridia bacterium]